MMFSQPVRVLYMEDDIGAARLFQKKLERLGYAVDLAPDGEQGLAMYDTGSYDLLAIDQNMPIYDGIDVLRSLAKRGPLPPVVVITAANDERLAVEAMKLGAGDYIAKDVNGDYLELVPLVIEQLLYRQRLIKEKQQAQEALERRNHNLALLNKAGQALTATLNEEQILEQLLTVAADITNAACSSVWICDRKQDCPLSCKGVFCRGENTFPLEAGDTFARWIVDNAKGVILDGENLYSANAYDGAQKVTSLLGVPLNARDGTIGVLELANKIGDTFDADDLVLVETLAASAGIAIDNARMVETLQQQTLDLQSQNEDLNAFSHSVAHDLKNPLSVVLGYSTLLSERYSEFTEKEHHEYLSHLEQSSRKMSSIIDELLLLATVRNAEVKVMPLNMAAIVSETQVRLSTMIETFHAEVIVASHWPTVLGYGPWIEEVWVNYLSNALKYGGRPPQIRLGATLLTEGMVRFWIQDNGAGLTDEQKKRLFTPFTRLNQINVAGHGLGLSIVRRIVEKLNGQVGVESNVGQGSIFFFTLPSQPGLTPQNDSE